MWRIVTPKTRKQFYTTLSTDAYDPRATDLSSMSSVTWYSQVMRGPGSRVQSYKQYDVMDADIDIARSLDIIAEEIATRDEKTNLPFVIEWQKEDNQDITDSTIVTVRAALRQFAQLQDLKKRMFNIARTMVKYGDCFFRKTSDTKRWQYIDPSLVYGIEIDENGAAVAYHIRRPASANNAPYGAIKNEFLDIVPASAIIHFTMSDDMGDSAPFGQSILRPIYRVYRQLAMLEDAMIIYRIVRAPERRVFYIDVGNMNQHQVKRYLEQVKNEMRQKKVPGTGINGGRDTVDGQYDPQCLTLDTRIPLLDGRTLSLQELIVEHEQGKQNWTYSCHPVTGEIKPGEIEWAGVTRKNAQLVKVTLDNGEVITCTPDHQIPVLGLGFVEAKDLQAGQSLISFVTENKQVSASKSEYVHIFDHATNSFVAAHTLVNREVNGEFIAPEGQYKVTHHKDINRFNNNPDNLEWMGNKDHFKWHSQNAKESWSLLPDDLKKIRCENISKGTKIGMSLMDEEVKKAAHKKTAAGVKLKYQERKKNKDQWDEYISKISKPRPPEFGNKVKERLAGKPTAMTNQPWEFTQECLSELVVITKQNNCNKLNTLSALRTSEKFKTLLQNANQKSDEFTTYKLDASKFSNRGLMKLLNTFNIDGWKSFVNDVIPNYNHKVVSVEWLEERQDTGCITIGESIHNWHTFPTASGVFVKNSMQDDIFMAVTANGRGSRVETLPGGTEDFGTNLLRQFQEKIFRGLRIPTSYLGGTDAAGAQTNDGKVGIAYIEELRFANFISRLQQRINDVFDAEFKIYLKVTGLRVDDEVFDIRLPDPANFALYRQAALDADLINSFSNIQEVKFLSRRFILKRYLGLTDDEIQMNETMIKEERAIEDTDEASSIQQIYDPVVFDNREPITISKSDESEGSSDLDSFNTPENEMGMPSEEPSAEPEETPMSGELDNTGIEDKPPANNAV